ncbi:MAG: Fe-S-containing hydro-lyase [Lentisphaeria bacterium]|nr:Fe-S-containing hydro-lyase [Lentisphaeria bacterium]
MKQITTPLSEDTVRGLAAGDTVAISGVIYTGRDAAHKKLLAMLAAGEALPMELKDQIIYFVGPCPAPPGRPIGSAGPTTSYRMDPYSPELIARTGLRGMIGKGNRSEEVVAAMKQHGVVYFAATGGAGALIAQRIRKCDLIAFPELGPEAVYRLEVEDFPVIVAIDSRGNSLYRK